MFKAAIINVKVICQRKEKNPFKTIQMVQNTNFFKTEKKKKL